MRAYSPARNPLLPVAGARQEHGAESATARPPGLRPGSIPGPGILAGDREPFDFARSAVGWGLIGAGRHWVAVRVHRARRFRLRLSDREGYVRLYTLTLRTEAGEVVWQWHHRDDIGTVFIGVYGATLKQTDECLLVTVLGTDSWCDVRLPECPENEAILEIECSWPVSSDYLAAKQGWESEVERLELRIEQLRKEARESRLPTPAAPSPIGSGGDRRTSAALAEAAPHCETANTDVSVIASLGENCELGVALGRLGYRGTGPFHWGAVDLPSLVRSFEDGLADIWCNPDAIALRIAVGADTLEVGSTDWSPEALDSQPPGAVAETFVIDRRYAEKLGESRSACHGQVLLAEDIAVIGYDASSRRTGVMRRRAWLRFDAALPRGP